MKEKFRRCWALVLVFVIVTGVCFLFAGRKSGMFIDEIYAYGLSNSHYAPFLTDIKDGEMVGKTFTRQELFDYVAVTDGERFDAGSVYYNQVHDVHPPLHYWLLNAVCSLFPDTFSKWTGLALNYVLYMLTMFALYKTVRRLGWSRGCGTAAAVLYGLSVIGLSTFVMIRMYMLLTLLAVVLMYLIVCLMQEFKPKYCILTGLVLLAGLITQYYFVFYAFFLCAAYVIYALVKREYKALAWFVPCALVGALSLLLVFPACIDHLFADNIVSGGNAMENLRNFAQYPVRLRTFISFITHGLKAAIIIALLAIIALGVYFRKFKAAAKDKRLDLRALVLIVPAFVVLVIVALISPVDEPRYIYNLVPAFVLAACLLLYLLEESLGSFEREGLIKTAALLCIMALALWQARCVPPDYLYPEYAEYDAIVAEHSDDKCVYFSDNRFEAITQDLLQLMAFDDFYVSDDTELTGALDYVGGADEFVAYVDISEFWSSGYDPDKIISALADASDYDKAELLYQNGLSATYLISK